MRIRISTQRLYFLLYSLTYFGEGALFSGLGPIIPFFSNLTGLEETYYSFLFACRSFGMMVGMFGVKFLQKMFKMSYHRILVLGSTCVFIFSWLLGIILNPFYQSASMFIGAMFYAALQLQINVCLIQITSPQDLEFRMLVTHGLYGIGGLFSPVVVFFFEDQAFFYIGLIILLACPGYFILKSPELLQKNQTKQQKVQEQNVFSKINTIRSQLSPSEPSQNSSDRPKLQMSSQSLKYLSLACFFYCGVQSIMGGWISSYAVIHRVASKQQATKYPVFFWGSITLARLIALLIQKNILSSSKLLFLIKSSIFCILSTIILIQIFNQTTFGLYFCSIVSGICYGSIYPLIFALSSQFSIVMNNSQIGIVVAAGVIAEGFLTMFTGYMMDIFGIQLLFFSLLTITVLLWICSYLAVQMMQKTVIQSNTIELLLLQDKVIDQYKK